MGSVSKPVPDLYTAEEIAGGIHGDNRLGGHSLLDCVVFSRVTRAACTRYVLDDRAKVNSLAALADGGSVEGSEK